MMTRNERLREELVQVAAVAVAWCEVLIQGYTDDPDRDAHAMAEALEDVIDERRRQHAKWDSQDHASPTWLMILAHEVGEAAEYVTKLELAHGDYQDLPPLVRRAIASIKPAGRDARRWLETGGPFA